MPRISLLSIVKDPAIGGRIVMVLAVIGVLVIAILLSGPKPVENSEQSANGSDSPVQTSDNYLQLPGITNVKSASEYPVTTGVIVGVVAVLMIIEIGTLIELKRQS